MTNNKFEVINDKTLATVIGGGKGGGILSWFIGESSDIWKGFKKGDRKSVV